MLREILEECKAARGTIGIEENRITLRQFNGLRQIVPEAKIVNAAGLVESVMAQPSKLEVEFTRKSGKIVQAGLEKAIATIKEGAHYYEVITKATEAMYQAGMTEQSLFGKYILTCVWGGPDGGELHETDVAKKIQKGDIVTPELWGTYKHYVSGAMGSVYVGKNPPPGVRDTYKVLAEMYLAVREAMKPGVTTGEVWEAGNKVYRQAYGVDYFRMLGLQQGVGFIGRLDRGKDILKPGMTYLVQPEVTDPLFICVCASIMVTRDGCEEISKPLLELVTV
jgi:Xaa-Pro aminopeptidase